MKKHFILLGVSVFIFLMIGCKNTNYTRTNIKNSEIMYYTIENGEKNYFDNYSFMKDVFDFDEILDGTIKSLNVIENGKRDLSFLKKVESEELKKDEQHKIFSNTIPLQSELKILSAEIENYEVSGLIYDKDKQLVKVFISVQIQENRADELLNVLNNQTYVYRVDNNKLVLSKYNLSQYD